MNAQKDLSAFFSGEPPGQRTNAIRWLQKQVMKKALALPRDFETREAWEAFRAMMKAELPKTIGIPQFPPLKESLVRARMAVGENVLCERVDVHVDEDYAIPAFVFLPAQRPPEPMGALVWNPGWPQDKWHPAYQKFAERMAMQGFTILILDHAPFGETSPPGDKSGRNGMGILMGMGHVLGISQLALRPYRRMATPGITHNYPILNASSGRS